MADPDIPSNDVDTLKAAGEGGCWRSSFKNVSRVSWGICGWESFISGIQEGILGEENKFGACRGLSTDSRFCEGLFVYGRTNLEVYNVESN